MPLLLALLGMAPPATMPELPDDQGIVVTGRVPHCHPRSGDPLDAVDVGQASQFGPQVIARDARTGAYRLQRDFYPVTGAETWQRVGKGINAYVFRVPEGGAPLCIGARMRAPTGWGQLRQGVDAAPYRGQVVRFSVFVATQKADLVSFWLVAAELRVRTRLPRRA